MLTRLRHRAQGQEGFTLIELLVVILIIGILAAVAIPVFLNQQGKAQDANVKSDITNAATAEETYFTDNQAYTVVNSGATSAITAIDPTLSNAITGSEALTVTLPGTNAYTISAKSASGLTYTLAKDGTGVITRSCTVPSGANNSGCKNVVGGVGSW